MNGNLIDIQLFVTEIQITSSYLGLSEHEHEHDDDYEYEYDHDYDDVKVRERARYCEEHPTGGH